MTKLAVITVMILASAQQPAAPRHFDTVIQLETTSETSANVSMGDLDGDGDLDLVLAKGRHDPLIDRVLLNAATAAPREVIMVRNAEEPPGSDVHLSAEGKARANALAKWIPATYGIPDALFASKPTDNSRRAIETLEPLAAALKLKIHDTFANEEFAKMAATVLSDGAYTGKRIVIAWQRGNLPNIARAFGAKEPPAWPAGQYDHLWRLQFTGSAVTLEDVVQKVQIGK